MYTPTPCRKPRGRRALVPRRPRVLHPTIHANPQLDRRWRSTIRQLWTLRHCRFSTEVRVSHMISETRRSLKHDPPLSRTASHRRVRTLNPRTHVPSWLRYEAPPPQSPLTTFLFPALIRLPYHRHDGRLLHALENSSRWSPIA